MFSLTLSRMGWEKLASTPGTSRTLCAISAATSSRPRIHGRHWLIGFSVTNISRLLGSVGSVPSSGRPSWVRTWVVSGVRRSSSLIFGTSRRPVASETLPGRVKVTYTAPSFSSGRNSEPSRGSRTRAAARLPAARTSTGPGFRSAKARLGSYACRARASRGDSRPADGRRKQRRTRTGTSVKLVSSAPASALTTVWAMGAKIRPSTRCKERMGM